MGAACGQHPAWLSSLGGLSSPGAFGGAYPLGGFFSATAPYALGSARLHLVCREGFPLPPFTGPAVCLLPAEGAPDLVPHTHADPRLTPRVLAWAPGASPLSSPSPVAASEAQAVATQVRSAAHLFSFPHTHAPYTQPRLTGGAAPFSSPEWLAGVSLSRPGRPFSATADLINFANGGVGLAYAPWDNVPVLFNWFSAWSASAARAGAPTYKL